jgi:dUTP pyrophosphatase
MKFMKIRDVKSPNRGTSGSAGIDIFVPNDFPVTELYHGETVIIPSGLKVNVPKDHVLVAFNKSGVATKKGLAVGACVIDEDYQGEIHIHLTKVTELMTEIIPGEKIVQLVLLPVKYDSIEISETEEDLWKGKKTERGEGRFGSTGNK